MRKFAESESGKQLFGFIQQTVRFPSISAIGDSSVGQLEFLKYSIKLYNDEITKASEKNAEIDAIKQELAKLEQFTENFSNTLNRG